MGTENPKTLKRKIRYKWENVFIGENPDTGERYFDRLKVAIPDPTLPPEEPPADENLLTPDQFKAQQTSSEADKMSELIKKAADEFEAAGRPMGGAKDD